MKLRLLPFIVFGVALLLSGCATLDVKAITSDVSVEMNNTGNKEIIGSFSRKWKNHVFAAGLFTLSQDKTSQVIEEAVSEMGGSGAVNVKIRKQSRFIDYLLIYLSAFMYTPETVYVSGQVVK